MFSKSAENKVLLTKMPNGDPKEMEEVRVVNSDFLILIKDFWDCPTKCVNKKCEVLSNSAFL
ncbi:hypothetical protein D3C87_311120 [compost metagenome]